MCRRTTITRTVLVVALSTVACLTGGAAHATDEKPAADAPVTPFIDSGNSLPDLEARTSWRLGRWYGWQSLAIDAAGIACAATFRQGLCMTPFALSGPLVHLAHGRPGLAGASLGIRLAGVTLGALIGAGNDGCVERPLRTETVETESGYTTVVTGGNHCPLRVSATGALVGAAIAAAVDAALGFERLPPEAPAPRAARTIEPSISIASGSVGLGLGGAF